MKTIVDKPLIPIYFSLSSIQNPKKLIDEILLKPFSINQNQLIEFSNKHQLLFIADGYDEQEKQKWSNIYLENELFKFNSKLLITCRINALPSDYLPYFLPYRPGSDNSFDGYQEFYVSPFDSDQIDHYIQLYISNQEKILNEDIEKGLIDSKWNKIESYNEIIKNTNGILDLMKTPLLSRLSLEAFPYLSSISSNNNKKENKINVIYRSQIYEAFLIKWMKQQIQRKGNDNNENNDLESQIWNLGQEISKNLYSDNRKVEIDLGQKLFQFNFQIGKYESKKNEKWDNLFDNNLIQYLPLQQSDSNKFKFLHLSIQEFLLSRYLYQKLKNSIIVNLNNINLEQQNHNQDKQKIMNIINDHNQNNNWIKDLFEWNQWKLSVDPIDHPILYFLADFSSIDIHFQQNLFHSIYLSKINKSYSRLASNAITILNASNIQFNNLDFSNISIPDADLSGSICHSTNFQNSDLSNVNFKQSYLFNANFKNSNLKNIRFYQYPSLIGHTDSVNSVCYSPDGKQIVSGSMIIVLKYGIQLVEN